MGWRTWALLGAALVFAGCSTSGSGSSGQNSLQSVSSWTCCAMGETTGNCACYQNTPNSVHGCSPSVQSCSEVDAGVGCCLASRTQDNTWLCECWPPGTDCSSKGPTGAQSVAACPPH